MEKQEMCNLKKRYLIWFYKVTKEALDRVERKFTQVEIDRQILKELERSDKRKKSQKFIDEFRTYIVHKAKEGMVLKFEGDTLKPEYDFLVQKLKAIEKIIEKEFGMKFLREVKALYEIEITDRILKSTEH